MSEPSVEGVVVGRSSRSVEVRTTSGVLSCSLRGRLRQRDERKHPAVVGDIVEVKPLGGGDGVLEAILPRRTEVRRARTPAGRSSWSRREGSRSEVSTEEHVIAANVDQVLLLLAARDPPPRWGLVDRVLVSCRYEGLDAGICLNKWDLVREDPAEASRLEEALAVYGALGYRTFRTALIEAAPPPELAEWLRHRLTVLSGHSGVGKSTLLNRLSPGLALATGRVSAGSGKGRHVTVAVALHELPGGGGVIDTPGYREYGLLDLEPSAVGRCYVEFEPRVGRCRFRNCLHIDEPGCAILEALERGEITPLRYGNYRQIVDSLRGG
ncbi:MAG: ribosome small subunit-dependent GTPase A [Planctomycetes bacterium]|nr:ribosome small subunit-dependent GTPase A [Planctomycetota bacterium]